MDRHVQPTVDDGDAALGERFVADRAVVDAADDHRVSKLGAACGGSFVVFCQPVQVLLLTIDLLFDPLVEIWDARV